MEAERISIAGRMGTFEIYANLGAPQGKVAIVHIFSKQRSGIWPNFTAVANRAARGMTESQDGASLQELEAKYTTRVLSMQHEESGQKAARTQRNFRSTS